MNNTETLNLGPLTRAEGIQQAHEHSPITRWFERWNEVTKKFDFYLIWNPNLLNSSYEI